MSDLNKRFCELAGIPYHITDRYPQVCTCGAPHCKEKNIDYSSDPIAVLRVIEQRNDWSELCGKIGIIYHERACWGGNPDTEYEKEGYMIDLHYLLTPGAMVRAAVEFMEGKNG